MELGRLTAIFDADTRKFDSDLKASEDRVNSLKRVIASVKTDDIGSKSRRLAFLKEDLTLALAHHKSLQQAQRATAQSAKAVSQSAKGMSQDMQQALSTISPRLGALAAMAGPLTAVATAFVAVGAAAAGIYALASSAAATADRIGDMAEKINFSVRTLSGLETAAEASGGSLEGLSTALGIFDKNIEAAAQGQERLSTLFKGLKVDTTNNEVAFRQVAEILVKLGGTSQQTALAMELFGRSGKDVLGIIKAADGNVEEFIKRMEALGIVIGDDAVKAADDFDRKMVLVKAQLSTVIRQLGEEFIPLVGDAASNLSNWMKENQGEIRKTIVEVANLLKAVIGLAQYIKLVSPIILIVETVNMVRNLLPNTGATGRSVTNQQQRNVFTVDPVTGRRIYSGNAPYEDAGEFAIAGGAGTRSVGSQNASSGRGPKTEQERLEDLIRQLLARGGGGKGGGGKQSDPLADMKRMADIQLRILLETLETEEESIERSYDRRRTLIASFHRAITQLEQNRHKEILAALKKEEDAIKASKTLTPNEKRIQLQEIELKRAQESNRHRNEAARLEDKILQVTRERLVTMERLVELETRPRRVGEDIGGITRPRRAEEDIGGQTRPRIATDVERAARDQHREALARIDQLGYQLTSVLDQAVYDGFSKGGKRGLQSLALGIIDMFQNVLLQQIQQLISGGLTSAASGGGWLSKIIGVILPGIGGALGGGIGGGSVGGVGGSAGTVLSGAIGRDTGGPIFPDKLYKVHKDEYIMPTAPGYVIPKGGLGGNQQTVNNYNILLPPDSRGSYKSPKSQRQLSDKLIAALQATQA